MHSSGEYLYTSVSRGFGESANAEPLISFPIAKPIVPQPFGLKLSSIQ